VRLLACGGKREAAHGRQAERLGITGQVNFLGFVDDIRSCFAGADVFAFPTFYDPCSLVVLEAMRAGLPVITTRANGAAELITDGSEGFIIDSPWDTDAFAPAGCNCCHRRRRAHEHGIAGPLGSRAVFAGRPRRPTAGPLGAGRRRLAGGARGEGRRMNWQGKQCW